MIIAGLALVLFVELLYFREVLRGRQYFRTNTMHKLYYIAWLLLGVGCAGTDREVAPGRPDPLAAPAARTAVAVVAVAALLAFPVVFQPDVGRGLLGYRVRRREFAPSTGSPTSMSQHPADAEAIRFLETYSCTGGIGRGRRRRLQSTARRSPRSPAFPRSSESARTSSSGGRTATAGGGPGSRTSSGATRSPIRRSR